MAIRAIIEGGRNITPEEVIDLAKGERDELGHPFHVIYLMALGHDNRGPGARFHTQGYQDAFITVPEGGAALKIKYGVPGNGTIMFEPNKLGQLIGMVAETPHNIATLAAEYGDKRWKPIKDDDDRKIREAEKKVRVTEDTIKARADAKVSTEARTKFNPEAELERQITMAEKQEDLQAREKREERVETAQESFPGKNALLQELADMNYNNLRKRAEQAGVDAKKVTDRKDMITAIVNYEASKSKGELNVE